MVTKRISRMPENIDTPTNNTRRATQSSKLQRLRGTNTAPVTLRDKVHITSWNRYGGCIPHAQGAYSNYKLLLYWKSLKRLSANK